MNFSNVRERSENLKVNISLRHFIGKVPNIRHSGNWLGNLAIVGMLLSSLLSLYAQAGFTSGVENGNAKPTLVASATPVIIPGDEIIDDLNEANIAPAIPSPQDVHEDNFPSGKSKWNKKSDTVNKVTIQTTTSNMVTSVKGMLAPLASMSLSSPFGWRHGRPHNGTDFIAPVGTPIRASAGGRVTFSGWGGGYGKMVVIDHGNGLKTRYAHCSSVAVRVGETVSQGKLIAHTGNTGNSTGPHLHYEVIANGVPRNPMAYLR